MPGVEDPLCRPQRAELLIFARGSSVLMSRGPSADESRPPSDQLMVTVSPLATRSPRASSGSLRRMMNAVAQTDPTAPSGQPIVVCLSRRTCVLSGWGVALSDAGASLPRLGSLVPGSFGLTRREPGLDQAMLGGAPHHRERPDQAAQQPKYRGIDPHL